MTDTTGSEAVAMGEIAVARDDDENIGLWASGLRENRDPILRGRGGDLKFYDQVRSDQQVQSTMQQRLAAVAARRWEVVPGNDEAASEEAAERMKDELDAIDFEAKMGRMHWGSFYGYSVGEIMWGAKGGRFTFEEIRVRRARRFGFDVDGRLMLRAHMKASEEVMPDRKFWVMTTPTDTDDEPYGLGLAHFLYWPVYFKRAGIAAWMKALNKFATPTAKGEFPAGTSTDDQKKLLAALKAIESSSAFIHPAGTVIDLMQSKTSAAMDYEKFCRMMDSWITKVVLSQTMTTEDGSSNSQSETHMDVREEVAAADADLICGSFNKGPGRWWTEWNFGDRAATPVLRRVMDTEEDQDKAAERDTKLYAMGWEPSEERITEIYGEGYQRRKPKTDETATGSNTPPAELAEGDEPDAITTFVDELVASGTAREAATDMLAPIADALDTARTFDELRERIDAMTLSDAALEPLAEHLAQAMFAARLGGEVGAGLRDDVEVETL